ncbi:Uncharacterised protein [Mycobacteroides abscessus subsp. abscessus]|nr:Uncharacterised protein [Mycobacteroides abscessus subsp. abscessus]
MPDSSVASRRAAAWMVGSSSSQWPPSCSHLPTRGCSVSSACDPSWLTTSAEAVICPAALRRRQASGLASRNASTE